MGLDRVFSYSLAGQELAVLAGLLAWNLRIARGFRSNGRPEDVIGELERAYADAGGTDVDARSKTLRLEAGYFQRNREAVAYADYRAKGWSTASSEIESAHGNVVQQRLKIAGAWWRPHTVDDVLALRMLRANGWWDAYWQSQRQNWRERAATFAEKRPVAKA